MSYTTNDNKYVGLFTIGYGLHSDFGQSVSIMYGRSVGKSMHVVINLHIVSALYAYTSWTTLPSALAVSNIGGLLVVTELFSSV